MSNKGLLLVISGPSGAGKGTVCNAFREKHPECALSVSATTRAPRPGEVDGVNYFFMTQEDFRNKINNDGFLEHAVFCGNYYGTPKDAVMEMIDSGKDVILEIEVQGAMQVKEKCPDAVLIMLLPPSFAVQEARLRGRGTETEEVIQKRLARTREEVPLIGHYDYVVYNQDGGVEKCADDIRAIVRAEQSAVRRHGDAACAYFNS